MTPNPRNDNTPIPMTRPRQDDRQDMPMSTAPHNKPASKTQVANDASYQAMITPMIESQVAFIQQWLSSSAHQQRLSMTFWQWFGSQPLSQYLCADDITRVINDWLLTMTMSETMRQDIRAILHTIVFHPANNNVPISELIDESQVTALAQYIASHESQRSTLIHTLIGNDAFTDMLTQTLYHAIDDFMNSTLDKVGGVGKLMKFGRHSFEKATNNNLDDKLQAYLHRNIRDLSHKAESSAQAHLTNDEVAKLIEMGWARIKDLPISTVQHYLYNDSDQTNIVDGNLEGTNNIKGADLENDRMDTHSKATPTNTTLNQLEAGLQTSYNRLRISPYIHTLVSAGTQAWFDQHSGDSIADIASSLHIDDAAITALLPTLGLLFNDIAKSPWLENELRQLLQEFYALPDIQTHLTGYQSL